MKSITLKRVFILIDARREIGKKDLEIIDYLNKKDMQIEQTKIKNS